MTVEIKDIADTADGILALKNMLTESYIKQQPSINRNLVTKNQLHQAENHYKELCRQYINQKLQAHLATRDITELENKMTELENR